MLTITPIQTPILLATPTPTATTTTPDVRTSRRRVAAMLRRVGEVLRRTPTPSERVLDDLQGVDTLRRW